ncbi:hypothetical protein [Xylocopilactobacillus apicola]|uniref:Uncharacterized protein n=1 Tax=Xylocopilactobacillus apicola TaxID=2932184 RepID=A0AAU9D675_9LACO|nr:hypothetical protein [Xylocopilactobacillus apicola]BDR59334.1 hypothetical protein XA3_17750 [Xylocopilactobacillus apicola]
MRIYIRSKDGQKPKIKIGYWELAEKMWYKEEKDRKLSISHVGNDECLQEDIYLTLANNKWLNDQRWDDDDSDFYKEYIYTYYSKVQKLIRLVTEHVDIVTVDQRALYIMAIELAKSANGVISEDLGETWISVEGFEKKHQDILSLSYDEANEMSLEEAKTLEPVKEPYDWEDD